MMVSSHPAQAAAKPRFSGRSRGGTLLNQHSYAYNDLDQRTKQTRTSGDFVDYGYDGLGQLTSALGKESGGTTNRWQEQFGYAYDAAGNVSSRAKSPTNSRVKITHPLR